MPAIKAHLAHAEMVQNKLKEKNKRSILYFKAIVIIVLFFLIQSCHSPEDSANNVATEPQVYYVEIRGMNFNTEELWINSGDMVIFTNKDMVVHDVTQDPGRKWTSKPIQVDSFWKRVFTLNENYLCSIHPKMKGKIIVR